MEIKKGVLLEVKHSRKGTFKAIAIRDFDTVNEEFYPLVLAPDGYIKGLSANKDWLGGEQVPCRSSLCTIKVV